MQQVYRMNVASRAAMSRSKGSRSVVEERHAVRDRVDVFYQPVVQLAPHAGRELADEAQRHRAREYGVV